MLKKTTDFFATLKNIKEPMIHRNMAFINNLKKPIQLNYLKIVFFDGYFC